MQYVTRWAVNMIITLTIAAGLLRDVLYPTSWRALMRRRYLIAAIVASLAVLLLGWSVAYGDERRVTLPIVQQSSQAAPLVPTTLQPSSGYRCFAQAPTGEIRGREYVWGCYTAPPSPTRGAVVFAYDLTSGQQRVIYAPDRVSGPVRVFYDGPVLRVSYYSFDEQRQYNDAIP